MLNVLNKYDPYNAMAVDDVIARYPTLGATARDPDRTSDRYQHIGTESTLRALCDNGFQIHGVNLQRVRDVATGPYSKHLIRLRKAGLPDVAPGTTPELFLRNAHNGTSALCMFAGMFRRFCWNGCVVGASWGVIRVVHTGHDTTRLATEAAHKIVDSFSMLSDRVAAWNAIELSADEAHAYANQALQLRYGAADPETGLIEAPIAASRLLQVRREADMGKNLWSIFNVVQENLTQGGQQGRSVHGQTGRRFKTRALSGIDASLKVNRDLFNLTDSFATNRTLELTAV